MVNLGEERVNHKMGTSGGIGVDGGTVTPSPCGPKRMRARTAVPRVPPLTDRLTARAAAVFPAPDVACRLRSGILALVAGSPCDPPAASDLGRDLECGEDRRFGIFVSSQARPARKKM